MLMGIGVTFQVLLLSLVLGTALAIVLLLLRISGKWFLAAGGDHGGFVSFYETASGKPIKQEKAPMHVHEFAFDESFETLYTVGHGKIAVWELREKEDGPVEAPVPA